VTLESAHVQIIVTLTEERRALIEQIDTDSLDPIVADAVTHELLSLIEIQEALANHYSK
jgi:hypothetical protein